MQEEAYKSRSQIALSYDANWLDLPSSNDPNAITRGASYVRGFIPDDTDPYIRMGIEGRLVRTLGDYDRTLISSRASFDYVAPLSSGSDLTQSQRLFDPTIRVRGFEDGGMAPIDGDGSLVGGDVAFGATAQVQYHLVQNETFPVYASLFMDMGTVFDRGRNYTANISGVQTDFYDSSSLRISTGLGFSLETPAGVLTLTYAVPQFMEDFDREERVQFSLGSSL